MCGRFDLHSKFGRLEEKFKLAGAEIDLAPEYNISPGREIACVIRKDGKNLLVGRHWGFVPF